jgi:uncharacterized protein YndB with AHSA1/START domain
VIPIKLLNMDAQPFIIERTYATPVGKVWEALTDRYKMEQWYFKLKEFKPEVGFEFSFIGGSEAIAICTFLK